MIYLTPKKPTDKRQFSVDLSKILGDDVISKATVTVSSGTVSVSNVTFSGQGVSFLLSGGADAETALLALSVTTDAGQVLGDVLSCYIDSGTELPYPSTTTKRIICEMAFEDISLTAYEFDQTPEEYFSLLRRLDGLMREFEAVNLDLGYNFPAVFGQGNLDDASNIPDGAVSAVATALACDFLTNLGKPLTPELAAKNSRKMTALRTMMAVIPEREIGRPHV